LAQKVFSIVGRDDDREGAHQHASFRTAASPIAQRLARTPPAQRNAELIAWLGQALQTVLRLPEPPDPAAGFSALGMDSLMAVELRNRLNAQLRLDPPLPATVLFDSPNLASLAQVIKQRLSIDQINQEKERKRSPAISSAAPSREAVAIVGMACRFPRAPNLDAYWRLLAEGTNAVVRIPRERLEPIVEGGTAVEWAALVDGVADFDPLHFGISPSEAPYIDPQHRILLEVTWHALENAGIPPAKLAGSRTGVFIGIGAADFAAGLLNDPEALSPYLGTGSGSFAAANRISHVFGLTGPSFAVNTACASSLTALHLAVNSLQGGECDLAVVGGVNLLLHPSEFINLAKARMLSPTGRTRSFSSHADGYVRGEGCGVVVLRRRDEALAGGDRIAAIIRGSAISHVGASNGMSAPNGPAQEAVMRAAAAKAGIDPAQIDYLEAQGTGTELGDAIEMGAIRDVMTPRRPENPLRIGAVKSNVGNLEEASGMAGLIKTVLAMEHGVIPPTLHFAAFNQYIRLGSAPIRVVVDPEYWPRAPGARRIAAVSGFGYGGANAHVVLEEAPATEQEPAELRPPHLLTVNGRTPTAASRLASLYADAIAECAPMAVERFCVSANVGRCHLGHRVAVIGKDREELVSRLRLAASGSSGPGIRRSNVRGKRRRRIAFLFSGHESLDVAPVPDLYHDQPVFREAVNCCAAVYDRAGMGALSELLVASGGYSNRARNAQPGLFALQAGLVALWESWGIRPDYVLGVGVGELAAAACAEAFRSEDGMELAIARDRLTHQLETKVAHGPVAIDAARSEGVFEEFDRISTHIAYAEPKRRLFTTTADSPVPNGTDEWPRYWREHARRPVDFISAIRRLRETGCDIVIEIGPKVDLSRRGRECLSDADMLWLASLQTGVLSEHAALVEAVSALHAAGCPIDFGAFHGGRGGVWAQVPLYPFERQRYWLNQASTGAAEPAHVQISETVK
jgi:acyl transferase domain-containing protein